MDLLSAWVSDTKERPNLIPLFKSPKEAVLLTHIIYYMTITLVIGPEEGDVEEQHL